MSAEKQQNIALGGRCFHVNEIALASRLGASRVRPLNAMEIQRVNFLPSPFSAVSRGGILAEQCVAFSAVRDPRNAGN